MRFKSIMLLITHGCNLNCSYCYEHKNAHIRMSADKAKAILSKHIAEIDERYDAFEVQFMGGEPLLNFSLIKEVSEWLWEFAWEKELLTVFAPTNGTILNKEMRQWFIENKERICLGLSYDGNPLMQDLNRSSSASSIDISFFSSTWPEQSVKLTISPETIGNLYSGVCSLWDSGVKTVAADLAMGDNIAWDKHHLSIYLEELKKFVNHYKDGDNYDKAFSMMSLPIFSVIDKQNSYSGKQCRCGEDLVCIDVDGKEYPCHLFSPLAISDKTLLKHLSNIDFSDHDAFNMHPCRNCMLNPICTVHCYGMNYKSYGIISKNSSFHCHAFKLLFAENCKLQFLLAQKRGDSATIQRLDYLINAIQ